MASALDDMIGPSFHVLPQEWTTLEGSLVAAIITSNLGISLAFLGLILLVDLAVVGSPSCSFWTLVALVHIFSIATLLFLSARVIKELPMPPIEG
ncbi:hypothetical protein C8R42DRAFT_716098 [Lentinula raphanica]|nr:hypothetical protein C8R42DRAFT_716098 [Lentinula raphanica]